MDQVRLEREAVTDAMTGLLTDARAGRGRTLFVVGEAGLGKTTCIGLARERAAADVRVGFARSSVMETALPFGLFDQVLGELGGGDVLALGAVEQSAGNIRAERFYAALRWLETSGPVLLALDDLHWADPDSLALLSFLCRRIGTLPVAVVATLRPWPPGAAEIVSDLTHDGYAAEERLVPLSEGGVRSLLATRLGTAVEEQTGTAVWRVCAGNPLLVEQVALAIADGEKVADGAAGVTTGELLLSRFAGLSAAGLRCAEAASVLGNRFRPEVAVAVALLDEPDGELALESLWRSGLVSEQSGGWVEFTHPLFAQALYDDLVPPVRNQLHARAFAELVRRGEVVEAAGHAATADLAGDAEAIAVLGRAGQAALRSGALATAATHLETAVRFAGQSAAADLLLALGEALVAGGRPAESHPVYERLLNRGDLSVTERAEASRMLGRAHFAMGAFEPAAARFADAAEMTAAEDPATAADALLDQALASWPMNGPARSLPLVTRARDLSRRAPAPMRRRAQIAYSFIAIQAGVPDDLAVSAATAREIAADMKAHLSDLRWSWSVLNSYGVMAMFAEQFDDAQGALECALAVAEDSGAVEGIAMLSVSCAALFRRTGALSKALEHARRAAELTELVPMIASFAALGQAAVLLQLGEAAESERWCAAVEPGATEQDEGFALLWIWHIRAQRQLREGQLAQACELYDRIEQMTDRMGFREPCVEPWARHAVVARLAAGRRDDAVRTMRWLEDCAAALPCRWPRIAAETTAAMLAEVDGDHEQAEARFRAGLDLHEGLALPLEKVETLIGYGAFLSRRDRRADARPYLAEALRIAETSDARWLAEQAREELSTAGGRRRTGRAAAELTRQERRVAQLAAEGLSNKEIAARLTVAVKTVEFHLQQTYTKLGIKSRRQLMVMAADGVDFAADA